MNKITYLIPIYLPVKSNLSFYYRYIDAFSTNKNIFSCKQKGSLLSKMYTKLPEQNKSKNSIKFFLFPFEFR